MHENDKLLKATVFGKDEGVGGPNTFMIFISRKPIRFIWCKAKKYPLMGLTEVGEE